MISFFRSTANLLALSFLGLTGLVSDATSQDNMEGCSPPLEGEWFLDAEDTTTFLGPGGEGGRKPFSMKVLNCGAELIVTNFGSEQTGNPKRFGLVKGTQGKYFFATTMSARGITVPITIELEKLDRANLLARWSFSTFATAPGLATKAPPYSESTVSTKELCECEAFKQALITDVENSEFWLKAYSDPKFISRPKDLDPAVKWRQATYEDLLTFVLVDEVPYSDAVKNLGSLRSEKDSTDKAENFDSEGHRTSSSTGVAWTDARTCEISFPEKQTGCASDIINAGTLAHEGVHRASCQAQEAKSRASIFDAKPLPSWIETVNDPAHFAANEVLAYKTGIKFVEDSYRNLCGNSLRE